jgi:SAM-dependent methyltransferase
VLADFEPMALEVARHDHGGTGPDGRIVRPRSAAGAGRPEPAALRRRAFDAVLCVTALCHRMNPDPGAIVRDFARITRPGGVVCLWEPGGKPPGAATTRSPTPAAGSAWATA